MSSSESRFSQLPRHLLPYLGAIAAVIGATLISHLLAETIPIPRTSLSHVYLAAALVVAIRSGPGPSIFTSIVGFLVYVYSFVPAYQSLVVEAETDLARLALILGVTLLTAHLAGRTRTQAEASRRAAERTENLYRISRRLASAGSPDAVLTAVADHLAATLGCRVLVLTREPPPLAVRAAVPAGEPADSRLLPAVEAAWHVGAAPRFPGWRLLPLDGSRGRMAVMALELADAESAEPAQGQLIEAIRDQATLALERTLLAIELEAARVTSETEQLRASLLSSVSHDLRTPLASIIGATGTLLAYGESIAQQDRRELLQMVLDEAERLNRYIQNLLDMTRLGHGALTLARDWTDVHDLVASALERLRTPLSSLRVEVSIDPRLPLLFVQGVLIEQVLVNLLDNAAEHSPPNGTIAVRAEADAGRVHIEVIDEGPGIPGEERERVFDMFYSVKRGDRKTHGVGLGLAICRGIIAAHGGTVTAHAGPDEKGTRMRITLPTTDSLDTTPGKQS